MSQRGNSLSQSTKARVYLPWDLSIGVISLIIGAMIFFIGQATIKTNVSDEEVIAEVTGETATG